MSEKFARVYEITGKNIEECKNTLNAKYGSNWVQCGWKKTLIGGFLGFGQKEGVMMSYMLNSEYQDFSKAGKEPSVYSSRISQAKALIDYHNNRDSQSALKAPGFSGIPDGTLTSIAQTANLTQKIEQLTKAVNEGFGNYARRPEAVSEHSTIISIKETLAENEFTLKYIDSIIERIKKTFTVEELSDEQTVRQQVVNWIGQDISVESDSYVKPPKIIVLCGPTGVGKTTTIAKLAAAIKLHAKKEEARQHPVPEIRIVTTDITRVGAKEQIEHWAASMKLTVETAEDPETLGNFLRVNKDSADYIFVDTAGYSPKDIKSIANMADILNGSGMNKQVFLTFSAGTKPRDLEEILRNYEVLNYKSVIITKFDETSSVGGIISVLADKHKSISYVTYGQDVFGTIERTVPARFLKSLSGFSMDDEYISKIDAKFGKENTDILI
ncbi:hypothetical protein DYE49_05060 [Treponema rectale]|uniref:Flagellar biosynthesis protein FlhF n=1 Tax=Treponema rectale TaxID=744512 RepID=A0A840SEU6_9SPIR|nr:hypothetical protein [Treponema rectale]MBB5218456.1 flagellar biosynthesis protein FlhF [Treponema rectale]QOS39854.1 hypothetical protein DYE49_05060 [Treponema rectale]